MGIHANTVQYRLRKINEVLGADITGNRVIPGLTIALALERMGIRVITFPSSVMVPEETGSMPVIASAIWVWPFPDTPAIAKISPERIEKDTSLTTGKW